MKKNVYFNALGIDPIGAKDNERDKLREAYDKAHDIRKFEIEMYWRRSAYLWTLQAAALAGLALISAEFKFASWNCMEAGIDGCISARIRLVLIIAIWCFGLFSAYVWLLLLRGAKFWQNNWERHVDCLEDFFSGALYKTYPVITRDPPYSVSKLNELMAGFMLFLWIVVGMVAAIIFLHENSWALVVVPGLTVLFFLAWYFDDSLRMSNFGVVNTKELETGDIKNLIVSRKKPEFSECEDKSDKL